MIRVRNFALSTVSVELVVRFGSDFENIVDVRAQRRVDAARSRFERVERDSVTQGCLGADEIMRETVVDCHTAPEAISADSLRYRLQIGSRGEKTISLAIGCRSANHPVQISNFTRSLAAAEELRAQRWPATLPGAIDRRAVQRLDPPRDRGHRHDADVDAAGTRSRRRACRGSMRIFGRDAIITALQTLWLWPDIARNVLRYLAATQCTSSSAGNGAEIGKILNESRGGGFEPDYYGVDTTPLFVMLAGAYYTRTADLDLMSELWPSITAALRWIDVYGDVDGDGFVETRPRGARRRTTAGRVRRTRCSMPTGASPPGPWRCAKCRATCMPRDSAAARIARSLGETSRAIALVEAAQALQVRVQHRFLVQGHRDLCARARRRQTTLPRAHLEPGPLPVHRHRACRARAPGHRRAGR